MSLFITKFSRGQKKNVLELYFTEDTFYYSTDRRFKFIFFFTFFFETYGFVIRLDYPTRIVLFLCIDLIFWTISSRILIIISMFYFHLKLRVLLMEPFDNFP